MSPTIAGVSSLPNVPENEIFFESNGYPTVFGQ